MTDIQSRSQTNSISSFNNSCDGEGDECKFDSDEDRSCTSVVIARAVLFAIIPVGYGIILFCTQSSSIYHVISYYLTFITTIFFAISAATLLTSKHIHYISVTLDQLSDYKMVEMVAHVHHFRHRVNPSISQVLSLKGTNVEHVYKLYCYTQFGLNITAITMKYHELDDNSINIIAKQDRERVLVSLILFLVYNFANVGIHVWYLQDKNKINDTMHDICASLAGCISVAFCIQQKWSALSIIFLSMVVISLGLWKIIGQKWFKQTTTDRNVIHLISLWNICCEYVIIMISFITNVLLVYCFDNDEIL